MSKASLAFECKIVEIRDEGTTIIALAMKIDYQNATPQERWALGRSGYCTDIPYILLTDIDGAARRNLEFDLYEWNSGTMREAHAWLEEHFDEIDSGHVLCTEYLRGERKEPKRSDRFYDPAAKTG